MALAHTILATLGTESYSGYDLWKKFSKTSKYYWQASQQQIYRELGKLVTAHCNNKVLLTSTGVMSIF